MLSKFLTQYSDTRASGWNLNSRYYFDIGTYGAFQSPAAGKAARTINASKGKNRRLIVIARDPFPTMRS
jgi:hypothetical protein